MTEFEQKLKNDPQEMEKVVRMAEHMGVPQEELIMLINNVIYAFQDINNSMSAAFPTRRERIKRWLRKIFRVGGWREDHDRCP